MFAVALLLTGATLALLPVDSHVSFLPPNLRAVLLLVGGLLLVVGGALYFRTEADKARERDRL